jgi:tRNA threonylcarbamoyladenosine biosynthesis protein TsaB
MAGKSAIILNIETSTNVCSASLSSDNGRILALRESHEDKSHAARLALYIEEIMAETGSSFRELSAVAISMGPGSYTGLRIGVSTAKGICYAHSLPLIAINTLDIMVRECLVHHDSMLKEADKDTLLCPMIDARRMEVYTAFYDSQGGRISETTAEIVDENSFSQLLSTKKILFFGNGAEKCSAILSSPNARFLPNLYPTANSMGMLAHRSFRNSEFADPAYFEPFYLKDFIATTPKNPLS